MAHLLSLYLSYFLSFFHLFIPRSLATRLPSYFSWLSWFVTLMPFTQTHANVCTIFVLYATPFWALESYCVLQSLLQLSDGYISVKVLMYHLLNMSCSASCDGDVQGRQIGWYVARWKSQFEYVMFPPDKGLLRGGHKNCSLPTIPETCIHRLTPTRRKSNSATGGRQDWFSARHQNSVKPLAWQPTDLRSPSIVCLIDYFPCNYSPCHTQYFTAPGKVQEGLSFWRTTFILSHLWAPNVDREDAHVKLKSCTGHQWWMVLIDWRVIPLCGRDSGTTRAKLGFYAKGKNRAKVCFSSFEAWYYSFARYFG